MNVKISRTTIIRVLLCGREVWSLTSRDERKPRLFENIGPKMDKVTGEWRKLHEELNVLYASPNVIRVIEWR